MWIQWILWICLHLARVPKTLIAVQIYGFDTLTGSENVKPSTNYEKPVFATKTLKKTRRINVPALTSFDFVCLPICGGEGWGGVSPPPTPQNSVVVGEG